MQVLTPTRSPDDEAVLRRLLKRERRAWHLSAFAEFAQLRSFSGWFTDAHPVTVRDGEHCVAAACARARWTRSRVVALWAARELDLITRERENPRLPPPGSCWVDGDGDVGCRWPEPNDKGHDSSYAARPAWRTESHGGLVDGVHVIARNLTAEQCAWIGGSTWNSEARQRAEYLHNGGSIETYSEQP
jgi:hypothetical protein